MAVTQIYTNPTTQSLLRRVLADINANFQFHVSQFDDLLPASSTDNALPRWDGTGGKALQDSGVIVDDSDNISGVASITHTDTSSFIHGDAGSADNAVLRADGTGGTKVQSSQISIEDDGELVIDLSGLPQTVANIRDHNANSLFTITTTGTGNVGFNAATGKNFFMGSAGGFVDLRSTPAILLYGAPVTINHTGADNDFRVAGDTLTHVIFVDASAATENIALVAGSAPNWRSMDRGLFIGNASSAPSGNPSSGTFLWSDSDGLHTRDASGNTGRLALEASGETVYTLTGQTTDGSTTSLSPEIPLSDNTCLTLVGYVAALRDDGTEGAGFHITDGYRKDGTSSGVQVGSGVGPHWSQEDDGTWNATFVLNGSSDGVKMNVVGAAGKTIEWVATVRVTEASV